MPPKFLRSREDVWKQLSYDKLKLPYTVAGYFKYVDVIKYYSRKLNLNGDQQKAKFISGLPEFMRGSHSTMRQQRDC